MIENTAPTATTASGPFHPAVAPTTSSGLFPPPPPAAEPRQGVFIRGFHHDVRIEGAPESDMVRVKVHRNVPPREQPPPVPTPPSLYQRRSPIPDQMDIDDDDNEVHQFAEIKDDDSEAVEPSKLKPPPKPKSGDDRVKPSKLKPKPKPKSGENEANNGELSKSKPPKKPRNIPESTDRIYVPSCERCKKEQQDCEMAKGGGACVFCRIQKIKCEYGKAARGGKWYNLLTPIYVGDSEEEILATATYSAPVVKKRKRPQHPHKQRLQLKPHEKPALPVWQQKKRRAQWPLRLKTTWGRVQRL